MNNDELRMAIAKAKGWETSYRLCEGDPDCGGWYEVQSLAEACPKSRDNWTEIPGRREKRLCYRKPCDDYWVIIPDWTENIADAWELVEEAHMIIYTPQAYPKYGAEIDRGYMFVADTAPRAICAAWLEWKGKQNDK